ncbi:hypothetical protein [Kaistia sp. MMO-174]|uniref:hypothetical protein n=1 Tax=Kaistia sp. MMO-174 TaxID=3081256 RepID=UPI0030195317
MERKPVAEQIFGHNKAPLADVLANDFRDLEKLVGDAVELFSKTPAKCKTEEDFKALGKLIISARQIGKQVEEARKDETDPLFKAQKSIKAHFDAMADRVTAAIAPLQSAADTYVRERQAQEKREREEEARKLREKEEDARRKAQEAEAAGRTAVAGRAEDRAEALAERAEAIETSSTSAADVVRTRVAGGGVATASAKWDFRIADYDAIDLNKLRPFLNRDHVEAGIRSMVRVQKGNTSLVGVEVFQETKAAFR